MTATATQAVGEGLARVDGRAKVTGAAQYAYEHHPQDVSYGLIVQASIARGEVRHVDSADALALPGVRAVVWAGDAPRLAEGVRGELAVLQSPRVAGVRVRELPIVPARLIGRIRPQET